MKAVVAAFNKEKALVGAFSVIMNLRMELFEALACTGLEASCWDTGEENSRHWSATDPGDTADFKSGNGHLDHIEML